jgi:hypothetical protein
MSHATEIMEEIMPMQEYLIPCSIERGGFTSERTFEIAAPVGRRVVGTAFVEHLFDANRRPLGEHTPESGQSIRGFVKCRVIRQTDEETALIEVPGAEVIPVPSGELQPA